MNDFFSDMESHTEGHLAALLPRRRGEGPGSKGLVSHLSMEEQMDHLSMLFYIRLFEAVCVASIDLAEQSNC